MPTDKSTAEKELAAYVEIAVRKGLTSAQLVVELKKVVAHQDGIFDAIKGDSNPQVVAVRSRVLAVSGFAKAVLSALQGDTVDIKHYQ